MKELKEVIKETGAYWCLDCGKCTANCPVSRYNRQYSPRRILTKALSSSTSGFLLNENLWACLTCKMCDERCPSGIDYVGLTKALRVKLKKEGAEGKCAHGGAFQSLMRIMTAPNLNQNRLEWLTPDLSISSSGEFLYFVGCLPYFDAIFANLKVNTIEIARGAIRLLNLLGISPALLNQERCCGHDLFWAGEEVNFKKLARENWEEMNKLKPKVLLTSCPECSLTLKVEYARLFGKLGFAVKHMSEFIVERLGDLKLKNLKQRVTFQDPCRLGRHQAIYKEPRQILASLPGLEFAEMPHSGKTAICCGTNGWMNCDIYSKMIQVGRLKEARSTGATLLVTACPKCLIHFKCAMDGDKFPEEAKIPIKDIISLVSESL